MTDERITSTTLVQVSEQHSEEALFWLLKIDSPELDEPLYLVNNTEPVVSLRIPYEPFPFEIGLPPDDGGRPQNLVLKTYNLSPEFMDLIRRPIEPPSVRVQLVSSRNPDFIEKEFGFLTVGGATYDQLDVTFQLTAGGWANRKTLNNIYNQAEFPALFFALQ